VSVEHVDLVDYLAIAVEVTGLSVETISRVTKIDLADSALHAPAASFGDTEFYPDFVDKAAVLIVRLAKNRYRTMSSWLWGPPPTRGEIVRAFNVVSAAADPDQAYVRRCGAEIALTSHNIPAPGAPPYHRRHDPRIPRTRRAPLDPARPRRWARTRPTRPLPRTATS
jgi:hypothetical protein